MLSRRGTTTLGSVRRPALIATAAGLTLALAGCGSSTTYSLKATKSCLSQRGAAIGGKLDFVAQTATGGAFVTRLGDDNWVTVAFGQTLNGGIQIEDAYERFAFPNVRAGLPDVLKRYANAVTLWHKHPQDSDLSLIVGCLH
jgi:hypothetical protein